MRAAYTPLEYCFSKEPAGRGAVRIRPPGLVPLAGSQWDIGKYAFGDDGRIAAVPGYMPLFAKDPAEKPEAGGTGEA
jgi:hypothetical protein